MMADERNAPQSTEQKVSVDFEGLQQAADEICWKLDEVRGLLRDAIPYLREAQGRCEGCDGAGVVVCGTSDEDSYEETCRSCEGLQNLIERITPRLPLPPPAPEPDEDDGIAF